LAKLNQFSLSITLYQTITRLYEFVADGSRNNCGKKVKLLRMSNFMFSLNDFFQTRASSHFFLLSANSFNFGQLNVVVWSRVYWN